MVGSPMEMRYSEAVESSFPLTFGQRILLTF